MVIGLCTIELYLPGVASLKAKRSALKRIQARLRKEFNVSCAELDHQDTWQSAVLGLVTLSNDEARVRRTLEQAVRWIERNRPDLSVVDHSVECIR